MKRFISFILLILLCFFFLGFGISFAAIDLGVGQKIEQAAASPSLTDNYNFEYFTSGTMSDITDTKFILKQNPERFDNQTTIKNIKENCTSIKADGTIASEIGTVLKCPSYRHL